MEHPSYQVGIDLGTTYTAAAVCRGGPDARPEPVALATASAAVASVVFLSPDGALLVGEPAQRRALSEPGRVVREFKRRIGDDTPLFVGGTAVPADAISARFVAWVVEAVAQREGGPASTVAVTHPVAWGEHKRRSFAAALAAHGVPDALFLTEPQAAAVGYTSAERIAPGHTVAVYDLGGGTFDAAVVRKAADGSFALLGRPTGIERLGGVDFDDAIFTHVRAALGEDWDRLDGDDPAVQTAVAGLRRECTAAKETLSADTEVMIPVLLPGLHTMVRLGRAEFEDMIRPSVVETVEALQRAIVLAEVEPAELDAVLLVGGSSRIPLVSQLVSAELGRPTSVDSDPKAVVAAGAAVAARGLRAVDAVGSDPGGLDAGLDDAPTSPLLPVADRAGASTDTPGLRRRRHVLLATAVVGVAAVFTLSATALAGLGPFTTRPVAAQSPAAAPAAAPAAVDPWTGAAADPAAAPGAGDTADALTTLADPRRPAAVAAAVRPLARDVPTGATGAVASPGGVVRAAGAPVTNRPATAGPTTSSTTGGTTATTGHPSSAAPKSEAKTGGAASTGGGATGGPAKAGGAGSTSGSGSGGGSAAGSGGGATGTGAGGAAGSGSTAGGTSGAGTATGSSGSSGGAAGSTGSTGDGGATTGSDKGDSGGASTGGGSTGSGDKGGSTGGDTSGGSGSAGSGSSGSGSSGGSDPAPSGGAGS